MDAVISCIYRLGVVTCLAVVVMLVACTGGSEPAAPTATPVPTPQQGQVDEPRDASPAPTDRRTDGVSATCAGQRDALVALYNATDGDNWWGKDNWLTDHPADTWFGVTADGDRCGRTTSTGGRAPLNLFLACEPKAGWRHVEVTERRTMRDFAHQMRWLVDEAYPEIPVVRVVLDNLNTHRMASLYEAFPAAEARRIAKRLEFHYTPKHGSWLNMAEIEFSVLTRCCLKQRVPDELAPRREV